MQSPLGPITFNRYRDAVDFRILLDASLNGIKGDIVRREITKEGYHPTYGDENV